MRPVCEFIALEVLPAVRAIVAKKLIETHGMSQKQAAEALGLTQPAVSQYKRNLRGYKVDIFYKNPRMLELVDGLAKKIAQGMPIDQQTAEFYSICRALIKEVNVEELAGVSLSGCAVCME